MATPEENFIFEVNSDINEISTLKLQADLQLDFEN